MTRQHVPYGSFLSYSQTTMINKRDIRADFDQPRLLWHDGISIRDGVMLLTSRYVTNGEVSVVNSAPSEFQKKRNSKCWNVPVAYLPTAQSCEEWTRVEMSDMELCLTDLQPATDMDEVVTSLGLPVDQGRNPLLFTKWRGRTILVSTLTMLLGLLAPSDFVFCQLAHPLARSFYARRSQTLDRIKIQALTNYTHRLQFDWTDICCLAYWLTRNDGVLDSANLFGAAFGTSQLLLPRDSTLLKFCADGYESGSVIVLQNIGMESLHSIWPLQNSHITLTSLSGQPTLELGVGPKGSVSQVHFWDSMSEHGNNSRYF